MLVLYISGTWYLKKKKIPNSGAVSSLEKYLAPRAPSIWHLFN